jgi:hypothetical protein
MPTSLLDNLATTRTRRSLAVLAALAATVAACAGASAYPAKITAACKGDYKAYCPSYGTSGAKLEACMRSVGGGLSCRCRNALADGGYISRKYDCRPGK